MIPYWASFMSNKFSTLPSFWLYMYFRGIYGPHFFVFLVHCCTNTRANYLSQILTMTTLIFMGCKAAWGVLTSAWFGAYYSYIMDKTSGFLLVRWNFILWKFLQHISRQWNCCSSLLVLCCYPHFGKVYLLMWFTQ